MNNSAATAVAVAAMDGVDLLDVCAGNDEAVASDVCVICRQSLSLDGVYRLPECHHTFHTCCIVTWFRAGDSSCPICRNRGINYDTESDKYVARSLVHRNVKFRSVMSYIRGNPSRCSKYLLDLTSKYKSSSDQLKEYKADMAEFMKGLKDESVDYFATLKKRRALRARMYSKERDVYRYKRELLMVPIVPLIIPSMVLMD